MNEWTDWSECAGRCDNAFQKRSKLCKGLDGCPESGLQEEVRSCVPSDCSLALGASLVFINTILN